MFCIHLYGVSVWMELLNELLTGLGCGDSVFCRADWLDLLQCLQGLDSNCSVHAFRVL